MFISVLELFKIGIGPSSSHTMGPMVAAKDFISRTRKYISTHDNTQEISIRCILKGSLAFTGKGHATDRAVTLGLYDYTAEDLAHQDVSSLVNRLWERNSIRVVKARSIIFSPKKNVRYLMMKILLTDDSKEVQCLTSWIQWMFAH